MTVASIAERLSRVVHTQRGEGIFRQRRWQLGLGSALGVLLLVVIASFLVDEPRRRRMEGELKCAR